MYNNVLLEKAEKERKIKKSFYTNNYFGKNNQILKNITKSSKMECPSGILDTYTTNW
jgi:hypothetical protein